eukprot:GHVR01158458.1.p1 GENE.GHVR01158458.1~~GHVR01158458.1.p1  ORF type:complete len:262 (-),score=22.57 GHVR01158458.1:798-1583(-)
MTKLLALGLILTSCVQYGQFAGRVEQGQERTVSFDNFEDYLVSLGDRAHNQVLNEKEGSNGTTTPSPAPQGQDSSLDILAYFRDVPREHWSCCMLGKLAGDKGFHCHANFYRSRIVLRNYNRAHNRKMMFHGPTPLPEWGINIMSTFRRCVSRMATQFHKCCYAGMVERRELRRWQRYRSGTPPTEDSSPAAEAAERPAQRPAERPAQRPARQTGPQGDEPATPNRRRMRSGTANRRAGRRQQRRLQHQAETISRSRLLQG